MGRGQKRGRTQRKQFRQNRENVWKYNNDNNNNKRGRPDDPSPDNANPNPNPNPNPNWQPFATQNPNFEEYYKGQGIVPIEEWDEFMSFLQKPLPAAFRINSSGQFFQDIQRQLENDFMKSLEADVTNKNEVEAIRPLPWYPRHLAWHLNFSRMQLRKNQTLERFHEFLKQENEIGNITRQEAVSMVPPLFLDVRPEHHVLDMCAAPGSKTFQLLELMHHSAEIGSLPGGLVIANDVDVQRCNLLIHQTKRMSTANLIVTNHEAQHFPSCHLNGNFLERHNKTDVHGGLTSDPISYERSDVLRNGQLLFDRVLCDVPCSGDGTLRKAPDIWRKWHSGMGNGLHNLQVQIAMRGLSLLKVGGRMVYSTCSMNPVENEAVVSEVLARCGESVELLDVSTELPELVRRPGLRKWKVRDKGLWLSSHSDVPVHRKSTILPIMFPSGRLSVLNGKSPDNVQVEKDAQENNTEGENCTILHQKGGALDDNCELSKNDPISVDNGDSGSQLTSIPCASVEDLNSACKEEVSSYPLDRCMRIVPHDQNSGAFFIAVFRKLSSLQAVSEKSHSHNRYSGNQINGIEKDLSENEVKHEEEKNLSENVPAQCLDLASSDANKPAKQLEARTDILGGMESNDTSSNNNGIECTEASDVRENGQKGAKEAKGRLQIQGKWKGIDPVVFFTDDKTIDSIRAFYGVNQSFPLDGHLVSRNEDTTHVKRIYYISKSVKNVLELNFRVGQRLKIASLGLKIFERQKKDDSSPCVFRISSEGLPLILPYISKQILHAPLTDFQHLLQYRNIKFADFVDADFSETASNLLSGCCVVVLNKGNLPSDALANASEIAIVCWKGKSSLSVMVSEMDGRELLERLSIRFGLGKSAIPEIDKIAGAESGTTWQSVDTELVEDS